MHITKFVTARATSHAVVTARRMYTAVWKREGGAMWRYKQRMESFVKATLRRPKKFEAMTSLRTLARDEGGISQMCLSRVFTISFNGLLRLKGRELTPANFYSHKGYAGISNAAYLGHEVSVRYECSGIYLYSKSRELLTTAGIMSQSSMPKNLFKATVSLQNIALTEGAVTNLLRDEKP